MQKRFVDKPSKEFLAAHEALTVVERTHKNPHISQTSYVYADVVSENRKCQWMAENKAKPYRGKRCIRKLWGARCGQTNWHNPVCECCRPPGADHDEMFRKEDGSLIFITQPYGIDHEALCALIKFCTEHNLKVGISPCLSWHFPGKTILIQIEKAKPNE